jgi:hypothetical protein
MVHNQASKPGGNHLEAAYLETCESLVSKPFLTTVKEKQNESLTICKRKEKNIIETNCKVCANCYYPWWLCTLQ